MLKYPIKDEAWIKCPIKSEALLKYPINQSWARFPGFAFPRSRVPGVLGTRERDFF